MPRYVILRHETPPGYARPPHWDFMLEFHGVLRTWALEQQPGTARSVTGEALPDHRIDYLVYEGPVSGDRGHVAQWDRGQYTLTTEDSDRLSVQLEGGRLRGTVTMSRDRHCPALWHFVFEGSAD